jgi:hypothetical protein
MKRRIHSVLAISFVVALILGLSTISFSQGCSDAGVCSIAPFKPGTASPAMQLANKLEVGATVGGADYNIMTYGGYFGYSRDIGQQWNLDVKITALGQSGNDISVFGPGDVFANVTYKFSQKFSLTGGLKIPLTKADKVYEDVPLPMDYQSSLGTLDLLAGIKFNPEKWQIALAAQIPLTQNENEFFPGLYPDSPLNEIQATNGFMRRPDLLMHISRTFDVNDRMTFTPGILPIYHLGEDEYTDIDGIEYAIAGSDGLTLNLTFHSEIAMGDNSAFELQVGFPLVVREARPDGLTRSFVFGLGYSSRF